MQNDVWSSEWIEEILSSFNVPGEMDFDLCDNCKVPTHINVAKWIILENKVVLICKQCQNKYVNFI